MRQSCCLVSARSLNFEIGSPHQIQVQPHPKAELLLARLPRLMQDRRGSSRQLCIGMKKTPVEESVPYRKCCLLNTVYPECALLTPVIIGYRHWIRRVWHYGLCRA